jgi:hypothetical protein
MCPAYAKKGGIGCKKWAKVVPNGANQVQSRTGMGFALAVLINMRTTCCVLHNCGGTT